MAFQITVDQIEAIDDVETLKGFAADLEDQAGRIEADLEFRSDADADWENRACAALGICRTRIKQINRRIGALGGGQPEKSKKAFIHDAAQAAIARAKAATENARLANQSAKMSHMRKMAQLVEQVSFTRCIVGVLRPRFSNEEWTKIIEEAIALNEARTNEAIQSLAAE